MLRNSTKKVKAQEKQQKEAPQPSPGIFKYQLPGPRQQAKQETPKASPRMGQPPQQQPFAEPMSQQPPAPLNTYHEGISDTPAFRNKQQNMHDVQNNQEEKDTERIAPAPRFANPQVF